jgi:hypothetical protein
VVYPSFGSWAFKQQAKVYNGWREREKATTKKKNERIFLFLGFKKKNEKSFLLFYVLFDFS